MIPPCFRFWETVEDFRLLTNKTAIKKTSKKIYEDFLAEDALDSVNVDAKVRVSVAEALKHGATNATFTMAQQQILGLHSMLRLYRSAGLTVCPCI